MTLLLKASKEGHTFKLNISIKKEKKLNAIFFCFGKHYSVYQSDILTDQVHTQPSSRAVSYNDHSGATKNVGQKECMHYI